jgi:hypothetical protein
MKVEYTTIDVSANGLAILTYPNDGTQEAWCVLKIGDTCVIKWNGSGYRDSYALYRRTTDKREPDNAYYWQGGF